MFFSWQKCVSQTYTRTIIIQIISMWFRFHKNNVWRGGAKPHRFRPYGMLVEVVRQYDVLWKERSWTNMYFDVLEIFLHEVTYPDYSITITIIVTMATNNDCTDQIQSIYYQIQSLFDVQAHQCTNEYVHVILIGIQSHHVVTFVPFYLHKVGFYFAYSQSITYKCFFIIAALSSSPVFQEWFLISVKTRITGCAISKYYRYAVSYHNNGGL